MATQGYSSTPLPLSDVVPTTLSEKLTFMAKVIDGGQLGMLPAEVTVAALETIETLSIDGGEL